MEDTAAEALQKQADIFRQKPLSAEEQENVKRVDRIILTSLRKVRIAELMHTIPFSGSMQFHTNMHPPGVHTGLECWSNASRHCKSKVPCCLQFDEKRQQKVPASGQPSLAPRPATPLSLQLLDDSQGTVAGGLPPA